MHERAHTRTRTYLHTHKGCAGCFDFPALQAKEEIDLLSRHIMSSDPDRSISFQLSDMCSIINKPSGATAPWSAGTRGLEESCIGSHQPSHPVLPPLTAVKGDTRSLGSLPGLATPA